MNELSNFLQYLRKINGENQKEMAKKINVQQSFLSNVEHGRKNVPILWIDTISKTYNLNDEAKKVLQDIIINTIIDKRKTNAIINEVFK